MVTQKIVTRLSNDVLPPVRMVSGDVGREIRLEIYASDESSEPIDLETYFASITIIKPDKTFVIQDFDNDKVELPEQAGAVTGHGYYQIKIYTAGDHQIYTGQGPFIVDDDILSEGMIESIAEVNGYKFPDDFLTDADLREYVTKYELEDALAGIIDDDTTDYNSTWSSYKINEALSNVGENYSTDERIVGKWIDGKYLYGKTLSGTFSNSGTTRGWHEILSSSDVTAIGISRFWVAGGYIVEPQSNEIYPLPMSTGITTGCCVGTIISSGALSIVTEGITSGNVEYALTIRYIKTS